MKTRGPCIAVRLLRPTGEVTFTEAFKTERRAEMAGSGQGCSVWTWRGMWCMSGGLWRLAVDSGCLQAHTVQFFMNTQQLEKHFGRIGARVKVTGPKRWQRDDYQIDIQSDKKGEYFDLSLLRPINFQLLQAREDQKHLLLLGEDGKRFLCGHDERHWFVAGIKDRVSTVMAAKASLMPQGVREQLTGLPPSEVDNRSNRVFKRQGEWFFVPVVKDIKPDFIIKNEPLRKTSRNKPHWVSELYRDGGETVFVSRNETLSEQEYAARVATDPDNVKQSAWRVMTRNANVYVRGTVRHADHSTVTLDGWHRVFMNAEFTTTAVAFLD